MASRPNKNAALLRRRSAGQNPSTSNEDGGDYRGLVRSGASGNSSARTGLPQFAGVQRLERQRPDQVASRRARAALAASKPAAAASANVSAERGSPADTEAPPKSSAATRFVGPM